MIKGNGKDYYTFLGLISRMETCRNRDYRFTDKDIPESVSFHGGIYYLTKDKKSYVDDDGAYLPSVVASCYGEDISKYLTEHDFMVESVKKLKITQSEMSLIQYVSLFSKDQADYVSIESDDTLTVLHWWKSLEQDCYVKVNSIMLTNMHFGSFTPGVKYRIRDLEVAVNG